jgi:hypothetical protein
MIFHGYGYTLSRGYELNQLSGGWVQFRKYSSSQDLDHLTVFQRIGKNEFHIIGQAAVFPDLLIQRKR